MIHYALVSDLLTREEFDERVEEKSAALGGVVDEVTAAMMVVDELGRSHVKIGEIPHATSSVVSFFGKVLAVEGPREFTREGEEERGLVASLVLGDPTGTIRMSLWDERAAGVGEISVGSVVEVIAKPKPGRKEVGFLAMRESCVEIVETKKPPTTETLAVPFAVKILTVGQIREYTRRDGSASFLQEFMVGDESGTARLSTWTPDIFSEVDEGVCVSITGVIRKEDEGVVEYAAPETAVVSSHPADISVLTIDAGDVEEGQTPVVSGTVVSVAPVHRFMTRRNTMSQVKNIKIRGKKGSPVSVALWGDAADMLIMEGDTVEVINAIAKENRYAGLELSVGRGAALRIVYPPEVETGEVTGCVIRRPIGLTLESDNTVWMLIGENLPEPGMRATVTGQMQGGRLMVDTCVGAPLSFDAVMARLKDAQ